MLGALLEANHERSRSKTMAQHNHRCLLSLPALHMREKVWLSVERNCECIRAYFIVLRPIGAAGGVLRIALHLDLHITRPRKPPVFCDQLALCEQLAHCFGDLLQCAGRSLRPQD